MRASNSAWKRHDAVALPVAGASVLVLLWWLVSLRFDVTVFPSPAETVEEAVRLVARGALGEHVAISLYRLAAGFALGSLLALPVGLAMGLSPFVRRMLEPATEFFRFIPAIAMVVFALIWFGIGEASKIFLIVYNCFFSVVVATEAGVHQTSINRLNAVRSLGASWLQTVRLVYIPSTVPYALRGMRIGLGRSFATIVSAEILAANSGLGYLIYSSREFSKMDTVIVSIILLGVFGVVIDRSFRRLSRRFARRYLPEG